MFLVLSFVEFSGTVGSCFSLHLEKFWPFFLKIFFSFPRLSPIVDGDSISTCMSPVDAAPQLTGAVFAFFQPVSLCVSFG